MEELIKEILVELKYLNEQVSDGTKISVSDILSMFEKTKEANKLRVKILDSDLILAFEKAEEERKMKADPKDELEAVRNAIRESTGKKNYATMPNEKKCETTSELIKEIVDKYFSKFVGKINSPHRLIISNIGNGGSIVEVQISSNTSSHKFQARLK